MKKILNEFKMFATKGNVLDLAIGVMIGGAFGKIVSSLVNDVVMPLISLLFGSVDFSEATWVLRAAGGGKDPITLKYGLFIQNIIDFLIIAICIFIFVKIISGFKKKKEEAPVPAVLSKEEMLLTEIRDLLKERTQNK